MHAPVRTVAPAEDPISLAEAKLHCGIDSGDWDTLLPILIGAATQYLDGYAGVLGKAIVMQTWRQDFDSFDGLMRLPIPAAAISSITTQDEAGQISTINGSNYALQTDELGSFVRFKDDFDYPSDLYQTKAIIVTFTAGYGAAAAVPAPIKQTILLLVAHWFANREAVNIGNITSSIPFAADALITLSRRNAF